MPNVECRKKSEARNQKERGAYRRLANRAKRHGERQPSGAFGRAERPEWWMFPVAAKSGAEVTAAQTLREFRRRLNFAKRDTMIPAASRQ